MKKEGSGKIGIHVFGTLGERRLLSSRVTFLTHRWASVGSIAPDNQRVRHQMGGCYVAWKHALRRRKGLSCCLLSVGTTSDRALACRGIIDERPRRQWWYRWPAPREVLVLAAWWDRRHWLGDGCAARIGCGEPVGRDSGTPVRLGTSKPCGDNSSTATDQPSVVYVCC